MNKSITVKQLGNYLKHEILSDRLLQNLSIRGEITNLKTQKYTYFSLMEDDELISCIYFDNDFKYAEGDKIVVKASLSLYPRSSIYQLRVKEIELLGEGENLLEFRRLKKKLLELGYFDEKYKKDIPKYPQNIGLITGLESAAYYDFIKVLKDNRYNANIYLLPSLVQGKNAASEVSESLKYMDRLNLDIIVLTRGGGSKDDLSVFNDELIATTIFNLNTPIISAIGHEIDLSIAELVSDKYLSTPTKAAEIIIRNYSNAFLEINSIYNNLNRNLDNVLQKYNNKFNGAYLTIERNNPNLIIDKISKEAEYIANDVNNSIQNIIYAKNIFVQELYNKSKDIYTNIIKNNSLQVKDDIGQIVDVNKLMVNSEYILFNDRISYKILVKEKNIEE